MNVYPFIGAEKAGQHNVAKACELLEVSRSAFDVWHAHTPSAREVSDAELAGRIVAIHTSSRGTYGAPRVHAALRGEVACSRKRVARIMRQRGLAGRCRRRWTTTTVSEPDAVADLLKRKFGPGTVEVDRVYVGDITNVWTWEGWLYLATVIDLASRRVVGWATADHMRTSLVADALTMAIRERRPRPGMIFNTDCGTQYCSAEFRRLCAVHQVVQPMSRPRQCWDNAVAESWFASLKEDLIYRRSWPTRANARAAIFDYIEVFYNRQRLHSTLGYLSPADFEALHHTAAQAA